MYIWINGFTHEKKFSTIALTLEGGGFDPLWSSNGWGIWPSKLGNMAGNLTKIFQKSQMPRGLPGGGEWAVLELTGTLKAQPLSVIVWNTKHNVENP